MKPRKDPEIDAQIGVFGNNVRRIRERRGLSQAQLCVDEPLDRAAVSLLEKAHRSPDFATLLRLARALKVEPAVLLRGVGSGGRLVLPEQTDEGMPNNPDRRFAANLRCAREQAKLSQEAIAKLADVDRAAISMYESGTHAPNLRTILKLARALKMRPGALMRDVR